MKVKVLSLFDGISCGKLAFERAGFDVDSYDSCEIDDSALAISSYNHSDITQMGSVVGFVPDKPYDYIIGGSPCQGFSSAGYGKGFEDPRSNLFFEYVRILDQVKSMNSSVRFLLENVSMTRENLWVISDSLGVNPVRINSSLVSGQLRDRYYWFNWKLPYLPGDKNIMLKDVLDEGEWYVNRDKSYCIDANYGKGSNIKSYLMGRRQLVFPNYVEAGRNIHSSQPFRILSVSECERLQTLPPGYVNNTPNISKCNKYKGIGNGWTIDIISHILRYSK